MLTRCLLLSVLCVIAGAAAPAVALGHGNPLAEAISADVVAFPTTEMPDADVANSLRDAVDEARSRGTPLRVAIVISPVDLGDSTNLFGFPEETATYLGRDLLSHGITRAANEPEPTLIVMPRGMGVAGLPDKPTRAVRGIELPANPSLEELVKAGGYGVQEIMAALDRPIAERFEKPVAGGGGPFVAILVVLGLVALVGVLILVRVRTARTATPPGTSPPSPRSDD